MSCRHLTRLNPADPQRGKLEGGLTSFRKGLVRCYVLIVCHELWLKDGKLTANKNTLGTIRALPIAKYKDFQKPLY